MSAAILYEQVSFVGIVVVKSCLGTGSKSGVGLQGGRYFRDEI